MAQTQRRSAAMEQLWEHEADLAYRFDLRNPFRLARLHPWATCGPRIDLENTNNMFTLLTHRSNTPLSLDELTNATPLADM